MDLLDAYVTPDVPAGARGREWEYQSDILSDIASIIP
jgi:hypothetical protein